MNEFSVMDCPQALTALKQGLVLVDEKNTLLFSIREGRVLVSHSAWHARLSLEDFLNLYGHLHFYVRPARMEIDEQRDQEYYAWRNEKQ